MVIPYYFLTISYPSLQNYKYVKVFTKIRDHRSGRRRAGKVVKPPPKIVWEEGLDPLRTYFISIQYSPPYSPYIHICILSQVYTIKVSVITVGIFRIGKFFKGFVRNV
jgi:hypothetical protein